MRAFTAVVIFVGQDFCYLFYANDIDVTFFVIERRIFGQKNVGEIESSK